MSDFFELLSRSDYMPHGHCYMWQTDLLFLHVGSDALIAISYLSIPFALAYFARKRSDLAFKQVFLMFSAFILACGFTHAAGIWSVWFGNYYLTGFSKLFTALISLTTAIAMWPLVPKALAIPSPEQLQKINKALQKEIEERKIAEADLHQHKLTLESIVAQRTKELELANEELKKALEEQAAYAVSLKENEERFSLAVQGSNSGIWDWIDVSQEEEWWSPRFYELLGYKEGEIEASLTQFANLLHPDDHARTFKMVEDHFEGHESFDLEYRLKTKSEGYKWFRGMGVVKTDEQGKPVRMVGSISDIHRQKLAEERIKEHTSELESARDRAEAGTRAKSEFLANMSHEIRTPMNSILGYSELMEESPLNKEQQSFLQIIRNNGHHLLNLINDILDLSKIESDHFELQQTPFDTDKLLKGVLDVCAIQAKHKNLALTYEIDANVPSTLLGDTDRLRQMITNLVFNAVKFTNEGHVHVQIGLESVVKNKVGLFISVDDTGIGIPQHKLEEIFDAFSQVDASDTRTYGGTGLGLAICKRLAETMNGKIIVSSEVGKGSNFMARVELEAIPRTGTVQTHILRESQQNTHDRLDQKKLSILLAEDDVSNRQLATHFLTKIGHSLDIATNGQEAIEFIEKNTYDIILMDIQMPLVDGIQVTRHIRSTVRSECQPVIIAVTARAMQGERERFISEGMDGYLSKPYSKNDLKNIIHEFAYNPS